LPAVANRPEADPVFTATGATSAQLAAVQAALEAVDALKQDSATAATDAEVAAIQAGLNAAIALKQDAGTAATDDELAAVQAGLQTAVDLKQDASTAATDAEVAAIEATLQSAIALKQDASTAATDAELAAAVTSINTALALKQDAATAATDSELAAEATARQAADAQLLPLAGGTMTGKIVLDGDPTANLHPATKQFVAAQIAALINGAPSTLDTLKEIADQLGTDESAVAALTASVAGKLTASSNLSDLVNAASARSNLGLGSAATHAAGDFDSAGAAAAAQAASQPLDSDLTAIAALSTTSFGRALLELADAVAARGNLGLGSAATHPAGDFDSAGAAAAAQAASQPLDSDLTAIAALSTTSFGRALLALADAAALRTAAGLGDVATHNASEFQGADSELSALAALTSAADKLPYFTGSGSAGLADFTAAGRALVDDADASAQRTTLGLGSAATKALDTDGTLAANSDANIASQKAVQTFVNRLRLQSPASGSFLTPLHATRSATQLGSGLLNNMFLLPIDVLASTSFDRIGCDCTIVGAGTGVVGRLGLYADDGTGLRPSGSPLFDAGTVDLLSGTGDKLLTITQTLGVGRYWAAFALQGTSISTGPTLVVANALAMTLGSPDLTNNPYHALRQTSVTGSLPSIGTLTVSSTNVLVGLRVA
jgi:hypothetical protein